MATRNLEGSNISHHFKRLRLPRLQNRADKMRGITAYIHVSSESARSCATKTGPQICLNLTNIYIIYNANYV